MRTPVSDPQRVGPYRIVGRLGSGGMGWVYLGRAPTGRAVAVKVVRPEYAADEAFRQRFTREVEAARAVSGAFTAAVIDADTEADPPWLATVYVPGPSLAEAVGESGPFKEDQVRLLGASLAEALRAMHDAKVVHRDLKPSNVLLAEDGPRVIDFGISRLDGAASITQTGAIMGTPSYMSPEQIQGMRVGPASDVFALGAVLVFATTGEPPFGQDSGVFYRLLHEEPDLTGVPSGLAGVVERCLAKEPERRPSLVALLAEFHAHLAGAAEPATWPPRPVAETIRDRSEDLAERRSSGGPPVSSCLLLHAQELIDAGLTGDMVAEAVRLGRS